MPLRLSRPVPMTTTADSKARLLRWVTTASVATAVLLILSKLVATLMTNSVSVMASLIDSLMDLFASLVTLFAVRWSLQPPDADHRFGHGKAEPLAALAQATFVAGSGAFLILQGVQRLLRPQPVEDIGLGIGVMLFSILATLALLLFQRHVIRRTGSTAIRADALHYATDLLSNLAIIAALLLTAWGLGAIDAVFGMAIGGYVLYNAWGIVREALDQLMDRELPASVREQVHQLALSHPAVRRIHGLRTRQAGQTLIIQFYADMAPELSLSEAHRIGDEVNALLKKNFPGADIFIHEEPASTGLV